jgi:hypothetical protein
LSEISGIEELELDKEESQDLAKATKELAKFYQINFDPKKVALFNFCCALGKVYVPRAIAIKNNAKKKAVAVRPIEVVNNRSAQPQRVNGKVNHDEAVLPPSNSNNVDELLGGSAQIED